MTQLVGRSFTHEEWSREIATLSRAVKRLCISAAVIAGIAGYALGKAHAQVPDPRTEALFSADLVTLALACDATDCYATEIAREHFATIALCEAALRQRGFTNRAGLVSYCEWT